MGQLERQAGTRREGKLVCISPTALWQAFSELLCNWTSRATQGTRAARKQMGQEQVVVVD